MKKTTLNPLTDTPENLTQVTKSFMLLYIKEKGKPADKKWFKELCGNPEYQKPFKSNLTGQEKIDIDIKKVREAFCERFFPNLLEAKKKKANNKSFLDLVNDL